MMTMTTRGSGSMELRDATSADISNILRANYYEWSSGLDKSKYYEWIWWQMRQPWARRNYRYMAAFQSNHLVSSCKIYTIHFQSRGRVYKIAGVGAVFTQPQHRGCGYGSEMIDKVVELCEQRDYDGMLLYSDIAPEFYGRSGFEELGDSEFHLWLDRDVSFNGARGERLPDNRTPDTRSRDQRSLAADQPEFSLSDVKPEHVPNMISHYRRYLSRQPFGMLRDETYWHYKLERERYLVLNSDARWPALELLELRNGGKDSGYAIFEHGGKILRVMEVIGSEDAAQRLWGRILEIARERAVELVRGWEGITGAHSGHFKFVERDWGHPMLLPFNSTLDAWLDAVPCPLLELDHF
jgi:GNAT superfamily N-acetyltransferase